MMRNTLLLTASAMINSIVSTQCSSSPFPLVLFACPVFRSFLCAPPAQRLRYHQYWHDWTALSKDQHCWLARWLTLNTHLSRLLTYDLAVFGESKEACCRVKADMLQHPNWSVPRCYPCRALISRVIINEVNNPQINSPTFITSTTSTVKSHGSDIHRKRIKMEQVGVFQAEEMSGSVLLSSNFKWDALHWHR